MIEYQYNTSNFPFNKKLHSKWIRAVLEEEGFNLGQIGYIFCNDEYILEINKKFLQHDTYTDIITFPQGDLDSTIISGDIYISIDRVYDNAEKFDKTFENELGRVMVHGILHLMGYDDHTDEDRLVMRAKEDYYLSLQPVK
ncbi:MAG: rRNA maturation RNase YbeY [Bacteroidales bacterium]|nr:rRNA maturation RNase YbeY [Bacteroidales bacterium]